MNEKMRATAMQWHRSAPKSRDVVRWLMSHPYNKFTRPDVVAGTEVTAATVESTLTRLEKLDLVKRVGERQANRGSPTIVFQVSNFDTFGEFAGLALTGQVGKAKPVVPPRNTKLEAQGKAQLTAKAAAGADPLPAGVVASQDNGFVSLRSLSGAAVMDLYAQFAKAILPWTEPLERSDDRASMHRTMGNSQVAYISFGKDEAEWKVELANAQASGLLRRQVNETKEDYWSRAKNLVNDVLRVVLQGFPQDTFLLVDPDFVPAKVESPAVVSALTPEEIYDRLTTEEEEEREDEDLKLSHTTRVGHWSFEAVPAKSDDGFEVVATCAAMRRKMRLAIYARNGQACWINEGDDPQVFACKALVYESPVYALRASTDLVSLLPEFTK